MQRAAATRSKVLTVDLGQLGMNLPQKVMQYFAGHTSMLLHDTEGRLNSVDKEAEPSQEEWQRVSRELAHAFTDVGCAYLTHHGLPDHLLKQVFDAGAAFFSLDDDVKKRYVVSNGQTFSGYIPPDSESYDGKKEMKESFLFGQDDHGPADVEAPTFMATVTPFMQLTHFLSSRLMTAVALSLGKAPDHFLKMHLDSGTEKNLSIHRYNYYLPMLSAGEEDVIGFGAHCDFTTFTLLWSIGRKGFQIRDSSGEWFDVPSLPGCALLIAGEFLHNYSNKQYIAPLHRVVISSEEEHRQTPRYTMCYFLVADNHVPMFPPSNYLSCSPQPTVREYVKEKMQQARENALVNI